VSYGFGLTIESLVAILLLLTILYCARLNRQIERLKADEKLMKASVAELVAATERAERAIGGLKLTAKEADESLGTRLRYAEVSCQALSEHLRAGDDLLARLRKIAYANKLLGGEAEMQMPPAAAPRMASAPAEAPALDSAHRTKAVAAAALAIAERSRARVNGRAA
jgi:hypothetical protein